VLIRQVYSW